VRFDAHGARAAKVIVGYGAQIVTAERVLNAKEAPFSLRLPHDPDSSGHFLVLLRDDSGGIYSAYGGPLPAGDYAFLR
jgi:hypothetical protein